MPRSYNKHFQRKNKNNLHRGLFIALLLFLGIVLAFYVHDQTVQQQNQERYRQSLQPVDPDDHRYLRVEIPQGATVDTMSDHLFNAKLIKKETDFENYVLRRGGEKLKSGVFYLQRSQSLPQIYSQLSKGPNVEVYRRLFIKRRASFAQQMQKKYHVLASVNLAQTILESNWGSSLLSSRYNNYYGIKAQGSQKSVTLDTREFINGQWVTEKDRFAVYDNWQQGMEAHAQFISRGTDLNADQFKDVLASKDYHSATAALVTDGYATDPDYARKLVSLIETYKLDQYDKTNS
ncbi:glycoside hydrolase family 73 protein [Oenococcus alcoholitolerans]|uniref:glycoside hydrolase family 73 protein n=1 Tax=Oenococcus alcoholitolerans TaxID=931074 RepID=UPI003F702343